MSRATRWLPWAVGLVATALYTAISVLRFSRFVVSSWDLAIFEQAIAAYAHGRAPIVTVKGPGYNLLGDHFSPIDALIGPIYRLFPHAQTILVAQAVLLGLSVVVVTRAAMKQLQPPMGIAVGILYAGSFGLVNAVAADFHEVAFAAPLLALAGAAWLDGAYTRVVWWSVPLVLVKEDFGMTVAAIGVVLMFRPGWRLRGALVAAAGVVATAVIVTVVIPAFNTAGHYDYTATLGGDHGLWATLTTSVGRKALTVLVTLGVGGLVAVASPWILVGLPTLAWRFTGDVAFYWGTDWHYSLVLMPVVFIAMVDVLRRRHGHVRVDRARWVAVAISAGFVGQQLIGSPAAWVFTADAWRDTADNRAARTAVSHVPRGVTVESDLGLLTHLATGRTLYWVGTVGKVDPQYVVRDERFSSGDAVAWARSEHGGVWTLVWSGGGYSVARRVG